MDSVFSAADTAFILMSAGLVLFMTPGLALFYGGMARSKNVLGTIMHSFILMALVSVHWVVIGYSLAFGSDVGGFFGGFEFLGLAGVSMQTPLPGMSIPHGVFMIFQCMFAVITPALITGAFAERMKFSAFLLFSLLWVTFVYCPMAYWVWGGGWMGRMGALDFAGGAVVHMSSGSAALAAILVMGKRKGYGKQAFIPHNLPMTILGAGILWFGWFGFNAGSALAADGVAVNAFVTTNTAAAAAALGWILVERLHHGRATTLGAASGAVAGLVAITPGAGFVTPMAALVIGGLAGFICYGGVLLKAVFGYDDSLDVVGIHGIGGTWGALATGLFAGIGAEGLFYGNPSQLWIQAVSVVGTWGFCFAATVVILFAVKAVVGLRVGSEEETQGLDLSQHSETAYQI